MIQILQTSKLGLDLTVTLVQLTVWNGIFLSFLDFPSANQGFKNILNFYTFMAAFIVYSCF
jgi:hypothetical protein